MLTTLYLLGCVWGMGQPADLAEWQVAPRLARGQELLYRGLVREQSLGQAVQFTKTYRLELRSLTLDARTDGTDIAILTRLTQHQATAADKSGVPAAASLRLEPVQIDRLGKMSSDKECSLAISLDGPTTCECGFLVETPRTSIAAGQTWSVKENGRPTRQYRAVAMESVAGINCVKLVAEQQSDDWDEPRAGSTAWRRKDTLWVVPRLGVAQKVERVLDRRDAAHKEPTYRVSTSFDLDSNLPYSSLFFEDRKREILQTRQLEESLQNLIGADTRRQPKAFENLVAQVDRFTEKHPATPYRDALLKVRSQAVEAGKGKFNTEVVETTQGEPLRIGRPAPEFVVDDFQQGQGVSPRKWRGKPVLMVFYQPRAEMTPLVLRQMQQLAAQHDRNDIMVVGVAMSDDAEGVKNLTEELHLTYPTLAGPSLRTSYKVDATPRFVVLDRDGVVQAAHTGWGPETKPVINAALKKCPKAAVDKPMPPP